MRAPVRLLEGFRNKSPETRKGWGSCVEAKKAKALNLKPKRHISRDVLFEGDPRSPMKGSIWVVL